MDFGIAMGEGESHVTRTGLVMGTPGFIAPEIIDGAESDDATDWWSVACVLAFAATGAPVFGTKPMMAVLERAAAGNANLAGTTGGHIGRVPFGAGPGSHGIVARRIELLQAIALDALNPSAWQGEQAGSFAAGAVAGQPAAIVAEAARRCPLLARPAALTAIIPEPSGARPRKPLRLPPWPCSPAIRAITAMAKPSYSRRLAPLPPRCP